MRLQRLCRRVEMLEKARSLTRADQCATGEAIIEGALHAISPDQLELLLRARLARHRCQELTTRELAAEQAYATAVQRRCEQFGVPEPRIPDVAELFLEATFRQLSNEELHLSTGAAEHIYGSAQRCSISRAGFTSAAECAQWYGKSGDHG